MKKFWHSRRKLYMGPEASALDRSGKAYLGVLDLLRGLIAEPVSDRKRGATDGEGGTEAASGLMGGSGGFSGVATGGALGGTRGTSGIGLEAGIDDEATTLVGTAEAASALLTSDLPLLVIQPTEDMFVDPKHAKIFQSDRLPGNRYHVSDLADALKPGAVHVSWLKVRAVCAALSQY